MNRLRTEVDSYIHRWDIRSIVPAPYRSLTLLSYPLSPSNCTREDLLKTTHIMWPLTGPISFTSVDCWRKNWLREWEQRIHIFYQTLVLLLFNVIKICIGDSLHFYFVIENLRRIFFLNILMFILLDNVVGN